MFFFNAGVSPRVADSNYSPVAIKVKSEASNDDWQDSIVAYSGLFNETLGTDANAGDVFISRPSSSPLSKLPFSTTVSALPVDKATRST